MNCIWKVDDNLVAKEVLEMLPGNFQGEILDVPIVTAVFTTKKFRNILDMKGFFAPPHFTKKEVIELLKSLFGKKVKVKNYRSILIFRCIK